MAASLLLDRLLARIKPEHGGKAHPGVKDWWYLSTEDSLMHRACLDEIQMLRAKLQEFADAAEAKRNGAPPDWAPWA